VWKKRVSAHQVGVQLDYGHQNGLDTTLIHWTNSLRGEEEARLEQSRGTPDQRRIPPTKVADTYAALIYIDAFVAWI